MQTLDKKNSNDKPTLLVRDNLAAFALSELGEDFDDVLGAVSESEAVYGERILAGNIDKTLVRQAQLTECRFKNVNFTDVVFESCSLKDVTFENCSFLRVLFRDCIFYNLNYKNCFLYTVAMNHCEGKFTTFSECKLKDCVMAQSKLPDTYFYRNTIQKLSLQNVDLAQFESAETPLKGLDFSSCNLSGIRVHVDALRGATVNYSTALGLIGALGIKIASDNK